MNKAILLKSFLFLVLLFCAWMLLRFSWDEQQALLRTRRASVIKTSRSASVLTDDAKYRHLNADLQGAEQELVQALENNSLYVPAWLALASVLNDKGEKERANAILNYTGSLTSELLKWRWERTLVAYELGRDELLPQELQFIINRIPGKSRTSALELAFRLFPEIERLEKKVGKGNLLHLFRYAISKKNIPFSLHFLDSITVAGEKVTDTDKKKLINMLISVGELESAGKFWHQWFAEDNIVYNNHFTKPIMRTAFGWRFSRDKDFNLSFFPKAAGKEVERELQFRFKGWKNLNFTYFYQIVPVEEATTYQFSVSMKSQKLTTDQRPFFQISGYKCKMKPVNFEMVEREQDWTEVTEYFDVPPACFAVLLSLRRNESRKIDSKMSGKLWIKGIKIRDDCVQCGAFDPVLE